MLILSSKRAKFAKFSDHSLTTTQILPYLNTYWNIRLLQEGLFAHDKWQSDLTRLFLHGRPALGQEAAFIGPDAVNFLHAP